MEAVFALCVGGAHDCTMELDDQKIDNAVLALMYLTLHDECRAWKSYDWSATDRLHRKGLIADPMNKGKSVILTENGLREAERLCGELFGKGR